MLYEETPTGVQVTTSTGAIVRCLAIGDLLLRAGTTVVDPIEPIPPTFEMHDASGDVERVPHNESTIAGVDVSDEERSAWADYVEAREAWLEDCARNGARRSQMRLRMICLRGIEILSGPGWPDLDAWEREQRELFGMDVPEDERLRFVEYVMREVLRTQEDAYAVTMGIYRASGLDQEVLDQIEDRFRSPMGRAQGQELEGDPGASEEEGGEQA